MTYEHTEFSKTLAQLREQNPDLLNLMLEFGRWLEAFPGIYGSPADIGAAVTETTGENVGMIDTVLHARQQLWKRATELGIWPPAAILCADGSPTDQLLDFCNATDTSLDWVFRP